MDETELDHYFDMLIVMRLTSEESSGAKKVVYADQVGLF